MALTTESMCELAIAHPNIATMDALHRPKASNPPLALEHPPLSRSTCSLALAAWDDRWCIIVNHPIDKMCHAMIDILGMGMALTAKLHPILDAPKSML